MAKPNQQPTGHKLNKQGSVPQPATVANLGAKTLVAIPEFATIDEIATALVLGRVLQRQGEKVVLYFGRNNYPLRLQKIMPAGDLKFYQPKKIPNEFVISIKVSSDNQIQRVRWEQNNDELHIFIEPSKEIDNGDSLKFTTPTRLGKVYLVGTYELRRLEDYAHLAEFFSKYKLDLHYLNNQRAPFNPDGNLGLIAPEQYSLAAVMELLAKRDGINLETGDLELLALGKYFNYLNNGIRNGEKVPVRPAIINNAELTVKDYQLINQFWQGENTLDLQDLPDFLALLRLTPQLNPLNSNFGTYLKNKPEGMTFKREATFGAEKLIVNDELRYKTDAGQEEASFRRFKDFLIVKVSPKSVEAMTETKAVAVDTGLTTTAPTSTPPSPQATESAPHPPSELNSLDYGKPLKQTPAANAPKNADPLTTQAETTTHEEYVPLRPAQ